MPDESSRNWGFEINPWSKCQYCLTTTQHIRTNHKMITPIKFHFNCALHSVIMVNS